MSQSPRPAASGITLDQLVVLNDEIAALSRAGVPLEKGLTELGHDVPGRLGALVTKLGDRLASGQELSLALAEDASLPPAYRAILAAGLRSGRLAAALEGMSTLLRRALETRRMMIAALVYPLIVFAVAFCLIAFTLYQSFPAFAGVYHEVFPDDLSLRPLEWLSEHVWYWFPTIPPLVLVVLAVLWFRSRRAWRIERKTSRAFFTRWPTIGRTVHVGRMAALADTLALLLEHDVPMDEAVTLATSSSGDRRIRESGQVLADRIRRGEKSSTGNDLVGAPPMLGWLLFHHRDRGRLVRSLRRIADLSRRHAEWMSRWLSVYLPTWLTIGLGGSLALAYALCVIVPWVRLLVKMAEP